ncbi:PLP-dependent aminotransferase family protein [Heyndrickxia ginsengihumi]|uniref:GntR family transcriptional regulator n=1 Tax=Heyndrickxia ginsengihumi TaxID=363870 RepID=A0A0A6VC79_9BACI|nr:PLP-dependent aminotransferase family protein [Heyndrickxia ginsengihumi]KHD85108.1 GntR family transcriptional regulator [Heyndrickxia ginsengihumi]MBE6185320.1 PLP-dependent aminotransferase family protein [Bacillus sp. (in: firmicutes)]MCM3022712.1 PLP-dependent aminotransferase family protein [Heyndrickxia ginsengihumi]NEY18949.1 PLP-dependent aminotransferase family protein [Heyndrickxia ginsengihumi]
MKELIFHINRHDSIPMYQQIYVYIRNKIEDGSLPAGEKLPSIRELAVLLNVSRNTTLLAYEQLQMEGYLYSRAKRGYFVHSQLDLKMLKRPSSFNIRPKKEEKQTLIDFRGGAVDNSAFPINRWRKLTNEVLNDPFIYVYGDSQGDILLRNALAAYLLQARGVQASPEQIVIGSSTQQLLFILSILLKKPHTAIAFEDPGYNGARSVFQLQSFQTESIPVSQSGIDICALKNCQSSLVYITPSHQFPLGVTMPITKRFELVQWAEEENGYIIEDDYDSEFQYNGQPIPALHSLTKSNRVIYISTFSKAFLPSIRLSYMVLPPALLTQYRKIAYVLEQSASAIHQRTMYHFMEKGFWNAHLRKMRSHYKKKMSGLLNIIHTEFGGHVKVIGEGSGIYLLLEVYTAKSEQALIHEAYQSGVKVYPCSPYYVKTAPAHPQIQIGFANLSEETIREGIQLLANIWFNQKCQ